MEIQYVKSIQKWLSKTLLIFKGETLAAMSDDHRSSNGNLSGEEKSGNVDNERVSSSLQTKQNSNPTNIATSGASYTQNRIR